jgi:hypothetical protein
MANPRLCEDKSAFEVSTIWFISKRRYGMKAEGNPVAGLDRVKSNCELCECLWLLGYKLSASAEGVRSVKMIGQIHKTYHPLGCSGSLNPIATVHLVNVGTPCIGRKAGLAAADEMHGGRENRSSRSQGKPDTGRRILASRKF